jgi:hypothetical protein
MPTTPDLLTFAQVADRLGVGVLHRPPMGCRTEQCPVVRDGRRVRIPAAWVDEPLAKGWR